jgi:ABC-2 type transport system ATP-binding protein
VSPILKGVSSNQTFDDFAENISAQIRSIQGVVSLQRENDLFRITASEDITGDIAEVIVTSGLQLKYLLKKEYGLDDIYNRYFEENETDK